MEENSVGQWAYNKLQLFKLLCLRNSKAWPFSQNVNYFENNWDHRTWWETNFKELELDDQHTIPLNSSWLMVITSKLHPWKIWPHIRILSNSSRKEKTYLELWTVPWWKKKLPWTDFCSQHRKMFVSSNIWIVGFLICRS